MIRAGYMIPRFDHKSLVQMLSYKPLANNFISNKDILQDLHCTLSFQMLFYIAARTFNENMEPILYKDKLRFGLWMDI